MQKDTSGLNINVKRSLFYSQNRQVMPSFAKYNRPERFGEEEYTPNFPKYQYDSPVHSLQDFHKEFESVPKKRKTLSCKTPCGNDTPDSKSQSHLMEEDKDFLPSSLPLMYHLPPLSSYSSKMTDLSNIGVQYYRTMDHFWVNPIKQEPLRGNVMWPNGSVYLYPSYSYYQKPYPGMMFPFYVPPQSHRMKDPFGIRRPEDDTVKRTRMNEREDRKQKVERVDVNVQIDESFYVDVGDQKRWKCPMCEKSYTSKYNLVTHILGHSGIKPHACTRCGKLFKQLSHLHTHMLTHQGTRPHKCQVCQKAFTQTSHLKRHMMQHSEVKPYNCRICGRGFAYPSELKVHEAKHESGRENICVECGLDFPTLAQLKRHLTTHRGPVQYNCSECDKTFQYPSQLQNHMMKHKDIRPYICSECGMEFVQPHHLKQHSLTHKGVKEHKCGICGREFTLLANMKRHVLIHTNIRAYQCHLCFKSFVQKQTLKAHMIVHSDIKPFRCKLCGKEFNRMHNLMGHMHLHSDSKPFKCIYCPSKFTLKGNLTRHMKVKHGVMERGHHSRVFGRGRTGLSRSIVLRSMEQKEPFDLSSKGRDKETSCHSDGESIKGSSSQDEEDEECTSLRAYEQNTQCVPKHKESASVRGKAYRRENEDVLHVEKSEYRTHTSHKEEGEDRDLNLAEGNFRQSVPDYLFFKNRNMSLKELLENKMKWTNDKQTTPLHI
ncbi:zinc finger protein 366 [Spea bombifrons]|uniref:zinc finger protein 366 n=1 Tax=Spea bombifrons TaxID=233779 RepID=UPI00234B334C|nr:zinc finger protein 366 [Spea bombifrons]